MGPASVDRSEISDSTFVPTWNYLVPVSCCGIADTRHPHHPYDSWWTLSLINIHVHTYNHILAHVSKHTLACIYVGVRHDYPWSQWPRMCMHMSTTMHVWTLPWCILIHIFAYKHAENLHKCRFVDAKLAFVGVYSFYIHVDTHTHTVSIYAHVAPVYTQYMYMHISILGCFALSSQLKHVACMEAMCQCAHTTKSHWPLFWQKVMCFRFNFLHYQVSLGDAKPGYHWGARQNPCSVQSSAWGSTAPFCTTEPMQTMDSTKCGIGWLILQRSHLGTQGMCLYH